MSKNYRDALTPRQLEIAELIAQGEDNAAIAAQLGAKVQTIKNHVSAIFVRLGVKNRTQVTLVVLGKKKID